MCNEYKIGVRLNQLDCEDSLGYNKKAERWDNVGIGKYVRYIQHSSDFMRHGDIGIVVRDNNGGVAYDVHWLNPIEPHTDGNHTWFVLASSVEPL